MYRTLLACSMMSLVLSSLAAAPVPKAQPKEFRFPTEVGTKWVYAVGKEGEREWTDEITASEKRDDGTWIKVQRTEGQDSSEVTALISPKGYTLQTSRGVNFDRLMFRFPPKKADTWAFEDKIQPDAICDAGQKTTEEEEEVTVPAGKFKAFPVETEVTSRNGVKLAEPEKYKSWFATGVGLVQHKSGNKQLERVLKSFTPAAKK